MPPSDSYSEAVRAAGTDEAMRRELNKALGMTATRMTWLMCGARLCREEAVHVVDRGKVGVVDRVGRGEHVA